MQTEDQQVVIPRLITAGDVLLRTQPIRQSLVHPVENTDRVGEKVAVQEDKDNSSDADTDVDVCTLIAPNIRKQWGEDLLTWPQLHDGQTDATQKEQHKRQATAVEGVGNIPVPHTSKDQCFEDDRSDGDADQRHGQGTCLSALGQETKSDKPEEQEPNDVVEFVCGQC